MKRLLLTGFLLLTALLPAQQKVNILLKTSVPGVIVFLDDDYTGMTGMTGEKIIKNVPKGKHALKMLKKGYIEIRQIIDVGELTNTFTFNLEKIPENPYPQGTQTKDINNTVNIEIILVIFIIALALVAFLMAWIFRKLRDLGVMGKFKLLKKIGKGGIATIYQARDMVKKRTVALKVMDDNSLRDPDLVYKFFIEGEVITRINTEFPDAPVVKVFDYGRDKEKSFGVPYISMELLKGESLLKIIRKNGVPQVHRKLYIAREVTRALKAAHSLKVYHGDITPDNVIVDGNRVVLFDFGVALQAHDTYKNMDASITGKPIYMSPELCSGAAIDGKSDIYSLGVILFFMFCGVPPFQAKNPFEVMRMHQENRIPEIKVPIDDGIKKLIYRLLEKDPRKRPDASELEKIFDGLLGG